jgi:dienelactone hydrolase
VLPTATTLPPRRAAPLAIAVLSRGAALVALVAASCSAGAHRGPVTTTGSPGPTTSTTVAPAEQAIGFRQMTLIDRSRSTTPNPPAPTIPTRTLETLVFYPSDTPPAPDAAENAPVARAGRPFPLVVLAHGLSGFPAAYLTLIEAWARAGYVVAAPKFPLTNATTAGGTRIVDYNNQPADVSFVITQLLAANSQSGDPLAGVIDPNHIAAAGHSLGAMTVLGLRNSCCEDHRISADIVLAGTELPFGNGSFFPPPAVPILFVHGTKDELVPYAGGRKAFADAPAPKFFVTLPGADHVFPYLGSPDTQPRARVVVTTTIDFLDRFEKGVPAALTRLTRDASVAGVASIESSP